ncbi:MAG: hypothetical protein US53_C0036G0012 [Candidatus Woesebacteria bacterium GW2011_GWA1_37_7]|uniref:Uncharacterized protein n=1 Tax=Candidatus Woesebacteria bacterium GW2011_GWA1_37_7 TaxID=1618545 RepID=A0A0G0HE51_9BACT|nr:MAG: hypothetical protein US53_C0036G0012 [Candidatus Woesebacteria bacterium GW2011_GWA1_37_7]
MKFIQPTNYLDVQALRKGIFENDVLSYVSAVKQACQVTGIYLYDTVQFIDEALQHSGKRKSMTNRNAMLNEYYSKMRHMLSTVIVTFPDKKMFDTYGAIQLDWRGEVSYDQYNEVVNIVFRPGNANSTGACWDYNMPQELYRKYFNSFNAIGFMSSQYDGIRPKVSKSNLGEGIMI